MLTREARTKKIYECEMFIAIIQIYAKQNHLNPTQVLDHIFKQLSKPVET